MENVEPTDAAGSAELVGDGSVPVIALKGELDLSNVDAVRATVERVVHDGPSRVIFDLSSLTFMDSSGLSILAETATRVTTVELRHASNIIRKALDATGLTDFFEYAP
jgi:anti-anti-sigma factor